jgi:hypothetical protein
MIANLIHHQGTEDTKFGAWFFLRPLSAVSAQSAVNFDPFDPNHFNRRCLRWSQIMKAPIRANPRDPRKIQFLRFLGGLL